MSSIRPQFLIEHITLDDRVNWETRNKIVTLLEKDPIFSKSSRFVSIVEIRQFAYLLSCRAFMTRTELYEHGLAVTNRIYELQVIHNWSEEEVRVAFGLVDEPLSIYLHNVGKCADYLQYSTFYISIGIQLSNPSSCSKPGQTF